MIPRRPRQREGNGGSRRSTLCLLVGIPIVLLTIYSVSSANKLIQTINTNSAWLFIEADADVWTPIPHLDLPPLRAELQVFREFLHLTNLTGRFHNPADAERCSAMFPRWILDMQPSNERKVFSQFGEDGALAYILDRLPAPAILPTFVEFGVEDGSECNTRWLRQVHNWTGLLMDGGNTNSYINLRKEMIHPDNIVSLFERYMVPKKIGYLSEDTDYADFFIWRNILEAGYRARVVVGEVNGNMYPDESVTAHDPGHEFRFWSGGQSNYYGLSALALRRLWNKHDYIMVYCTKEQINCFGLHQDDILPVEMRNPKGLAEAQECLWNKPLAWPVRLHACQDSLETWSYVDENGEVTDQEVTPRIMEYCRIELARLATEEAAWKRKKMV